MSEDPNIGSTRIGDTPMGGPGTGDPNIGVTTVEANEHRAQVRPYDATPLIDLHPGTIACSFCGNNRFRRSRLRFHDLKELVLLRFPLRCTRCSQRQYNDFAIAWLSYPPKSHGPRLAQGSETWQSWTEGSFDGPSQRPLSTAIGTRAQRLTPPVAQAPPPVAPAPHTTPRTGPPPSSVPSRPRGDGIW